MSLARRDFASSVVLHGAVMLIALNWTPFLREAPPKFEPLPVELVPISELTKIMKKKPIEQVAPEEPVTEVNKAPPVQEAPAEAPVEVVPEKMAKPAENKKQEKKEAPKPAEENLFSVAAPMPRARPAQQKPKLDVNKLKLLLDKTPDTAVPAPAQDDVVEEMTLSEIDSFRAQMVRCWSFPAGARQGDDLAVIVRVSLLSTGMVGEGPVVLNRDRLADPFFRAAAESVLRAIRRCQPYQLPAEKYERWRDLELNFDPRLMLGG